MTVSGSTRLGARKSQVTSQRAGSGKQGVGTVEGSKGPIEFLRPLSAVRPLPMILNCRLLTRDVWPAVSGSPDWGACLAALNFVPPRETWDLRHS